MAIILEAAEMPWSILSCVIRENEVVCSMVRFQTREMLGLNPETPTLPRVAGVIVFGKSYQAMLYVCGFSAFGED